MVAVVSGLLVLLINWLGLGFLASFISAPELKGFIIRLPLTIIAGQLPKLFGIFKGEASSSAR